MLDDALKCYGRVLAGNERKLGNDHIDTITTVQNMGVIFYRQAMYDKALEWVGRALAVTERVHGEDHLNTLNSISGIATAYFKLRLAGSP